MAKQARILDDERIYKAKAECRDSRELSILLLSMYAGLRAVEIAGLDWRHVDLHETSGALLLKTTKGKKPRNVPLNRELREALIAYRATRAGHDDKDDPVFVRKAHKGEPGDNQRLTPNAVAAWLHYFYQDRLGWDGFSSHSGRRTFATRLARKGLNLKDVKALMGHEFMSTTALYIDTDENAQRSVVESI